MSSPPRRREAVRPRSRVGAGAQQDLAGAFPRGGDLSHRPLSGKEPVQNILYTRFANAMFEPLSNRHYVRSIQITMAENPRRSGPREFLRRRRRSSRCGPKSHVASPCERHDGRPHRRGARGATRPESRAAQGSSSADAASVVRGQYRGYRDVKGVRPDSMTETYVAVKLFVDSWRWAGVPIYIRAGKCLPLTAAEVTVEYKSPPRSAFGEKIDPSADYLRARLSPTLGLPWVCG